MYSLFLAKLVSLQRRLQASGGAFKCRGERERHADFRGLSIARVVRFHPDKAPDSRSGVKVGQDFAAAR